MGISNNYLLPPPPPRFLNLQGVKTSETLNIRGRSVSDHQQAVLLETLIRETGTYAIFESSIKTNWEDLDELIKFISVKESVKDSNYQKKLGHHFLSSPSINTLISWGYKGDI